MNSRKATIIVLSLLFLLIGLIAGGMGGWEKFRSSQCTATVSGTLDSEYTVRISKKGGVETGRTYDVTYSFKADNQTFKGKDTLKTMPIFAATTVRYEPGNPANNELEPKNWGRAITGLVLILGSLIGLVVGILKRS